jgi:hypothetical protein
MKKTTNYIEWKAMPSGSLNRSSCPGLNPGMIEPLCGKRENGDDERLSTGKM